MTTKSNQVRIIGGKWRGRKIQFPAVAALRPTGDKVRETAFNWLQMSLNEAKCLDMFAGAGVFGFEALSRGAGSVVMVDENRQVVDKLFENKQMLEITNELTILCQHIPSKELKLKLDENPFDIAFIDPPFHQGLVSVAIEFLEASGCLKEGALVYVETEDTLELQVPENWVIRKAKKAGRVRYYLCEFGI